jgi:thymidylate synthase (FAD)
MELSKWKMDKIEKHLEECGRNCYKSEDRITDTSAPRFVEKICRRHHLSVLEHEGLTARITCSRACSHQLVRHRIAAYSQESMRYCNYGKRGLQVICPPSIGIPPGEYHWQGYECLTDVQNSWLSTIKACYDEYLREMADGVKPEDARFVLPHATKTCVVATYNMSMWRHVIEERGLNTHAQWEIREIFHGIYEDLRTKLASIFGDLQ